MKSLFERYRILRYLVAGGSASALHLGTLFSLTRLFNFWYVYATTVGFIMAFCVSFILQKFWTFQNKDKERLHKELVLFLGVAVCNLFLNAALMYVLVEYWGLWYLPAQVVVSGTIAAESFFIYRAFIF